MDSNGDFLLRLNIGREGVQDVLLNAATDIEEAEAISIYEKIRRGIRMINDILEGKSNREVTYETKSKAPF